jgi:hypothetical protein
MFLSRFQIELKEKRVEISPCCLTSRPGRIDLPSLADASEVVPIAVTADVTPAKEAGGEKLWMGISHLSLRRHPGSHLPVSPASALI